VRGVGMEIDDEIVRVGAFKARRGPGSQYRPRKEDADRGQVREIPDEGLKPLSALRGPRVEQDKPVPPAPKYVNPIGRKQIKDQYSVLTSAVECDHIGRGRERRGPNVGLGQFE